MMGYGRAPIRYGAYGDDAIMTTSSDLIPGEDGEAYLCDTSDELIHSPIGRMVITAAVFWGTMRVLDSVFGSRS